MSKSPVLFDLDDDDSAPISVTDAPVVPDLSPAGDAAVSGAAMRGAANWAARPRSALSRWFWAIVLILVGAVISVAAWDFASNLIDRLPLLGWAVTLAMGVAVVLALALGLRELAALSRLRRVDGLRQAADAARSSDDLKAARAVTTRLDALYRSRGDTSWGRAKFSERKDEVLDAGALLDLMEDSVLAPLDAAALRQVEGAARQVATVTALVPLALADVITALFTSMRMIRRIAEIYGGRSGFFSSWRLTRAVLTHLVATGAVAAGEDLLEPVLGGSVLSKLSRRFGEGLVNGALSARVGIAAMEVCRPLPFSKRHKPSVRGVIRRALTGLFTSSRKSANNTDSVNQA
jgi:putative membrane protein